MGRKLKFGLAAGVAAAALLSGSNAFAGAFALREQSTVGLGEAFAGAAAGAAGLNSMFWNPATITQFQGWNGQQSFSFIAPYAKLNTTFSAIPAAFGDAGNIGESAFLPAGAGSIQVNDRLFIGISTGAPFGLRTKPNQVWQGELYSRSSSVSSFNATPTVGYKVTDWLSVGAGLQIEYFKTKLSSALPIGGPGTFPSFRLVGDNTAVGFTAGATITPLVGTTIGLGFRSSIEHKLEGDASAAFVGPTTAINTTIRTPEMLTLGISQVVTDRFTLNGGVEWTNWSRFGTFPVRNSATGGNYTLLGNPVSLAFRYKDGWMFSVGGEYAIDPSWTVRSGFGYEISPIRDDTRSTRLPDNDRYWASIGLSYKWSDKLTFDAAYTHLFTVGTKIAIIPGNPSYNPGFGPYTANVDSNVNIVSVGLRYNFGDTVKKEAPLVRKY